jgi:hypothetical protein
MACLLEEDIHSEDLFRVQSFLVIVNQSEKRSHDIQGFFKLVLLILEGLTVTLLLTVRSESIEEIRELF